MKAILYHRYGGPNVVGLADVPKPSPKENEILIRIVATTVTTGDWRARSLVMPAGFGLLGRLVFGVFGPRQPILGTELAGIVEAVGRSVRRFRVGDEVFGFPSGSFGCHAEYRTMQEDGMVALKPANLCFEEAAALSFGGTTALNFLTEKAGIARGDKVLVVGASGSVGSAAVQIAKSFGAEVTAVCSTANAELVRSIGADRVIDYTREDFAADSATYDIVFDTTGTAPFGRCEPVLKRGGRLISVLATLSLRSARPSKASGKRIIAGVAALRPDDMLTLARLAESGALRPVIDRSYPLEDAAAAHAYVDTGRKRGNVVLTIGPAVERVTDARRPGAMAL
jgi:NADPH:quinone reductase-like Zn-dependent oxidoreductase